MIDERARAHYFASGRRVRAAHPSSAHRMLSRPRQFGLSLLASLSVTAASAAQQSGKSEDVPAPRSVASALAAEGTERIVTIGGRSSVNSGSLQSGSFDVAIQDSTGGIRIFSRSIRTKLREGDSVVATGTIRRYRGDAELLATRIIVVPSERRLVTPRDVPIDVSVMKRFPGQLVRVLGRVSGFGHSEGGQLLRLQNASNVTGGTITVWVPANHGAPVDLSEVRPNDSLAVTGIVASYQDNADDPVV